jgi:hypothetical protein
VYRPAALTKDEKTKKERSSSAKSAHPVVAALTEADWQGRADDLLAKSAFPEKLSRLAEIMAAGNKTGRVSLSRVVARLYEPLLDLEGRISGEAIRYGLEAAIRAEAANANYVAKAASSYTTHPRRNGLAATPRSGGLDDYDDFFTTNLEDHHA